MADSESVELRPTRWGELVPATHLVFTVGQAVAETSLRLDVYICRRHRGLSRSYLQERIRAGDVLVNGEPARASRRVRPGDVVELYYGRTSDRPLVAEDLPLSILHEDEHLIVVDKPSGIASQPRDRHIGGSLVNRLVHHLSRRAGVYKAPRVVHRLDFDTTGVVLYAKTEEALRDVAAQFRRRTLEKVYLAIVAGHPDPPEFTIDAPIGRHPHVKEMRAVRSGGKPSRSHVRVLERLGDASALEVRLETGRTHQIRVHLAHAGHPIAGDAMYGGPRIEGLARCALHARRLGLVHPATGEPVAYEAPVPLDLAAVLDRLREAGRG